MHFIAKNWKILFEEDVSAALFGVGGLVII